MKNRYKNVIVRFMVNLSVILIEGKKEIHKARKGKKKERRKSRIWKKQREVSKERNINRDCYFITNNDR
jgi:hypothetical protein